jgi:hypothetical protein
MTAYDVEAAARELVVEIRKCGPGTAYGCARHYLQRAHDAGLTARPATLADVPAAELEAVRAEIEPMVRFPKLAGGSDAHKAALRSFLQRLTAASGRTPTREACDVG